MERISNNYLKLIADPRLAEKTGKNWKEWYTFLDRFHAMGLGRKELLRLLKKNFRLSLSWQQALVMAYENEKKGATSASSASAFTISVSGEFDIPLPALSNLWTDIKLRNTWFPVVTCCILKENSRKTVRLLWPDSISLVELKFSRIDKSRAGLEIVHTHLPSKDIATEMEAYWKKVLHQLEESITSDQFHPVILDI